MINNPKLIKEIDKSLSKTNIALENKILKLREQKLIEKLEEAIDFAKTSKDLTSKAKIEVLENVLKIL